MGAVNSSSFSAEVIDDSEMTGALPGRVLRGPGYVHNVTCPDTRLTGLP